MKRSPEISVITVVFNDRDQIEGTIQSVLNQTYPHMEHLIVDGGSTDGTLDVIGKFAEKIRLISEPDQGLYDAMNKGLHAAKGEYVWYLNSGDKLYREDTVEQMVSQMETENEGMPDVIYGGTMIIGRDGREIGDRRLKPPGNLSWKSFRKGMIVCHQSLVVRRAVAVEFDLKYAIAADIDWAIRSTQKAGSVYNSAMVLSKFLEGGASGRNIRLSLKERFRIMTNHFGFLPTLLRHFLFAIRLGYFYLLNRRI